MLYLLIKYIYSYHVELVVFTFDAHNLKYSERFKGERFFNTCYLQPSYPNAASFTPQGHLASAWLIQSVALYKTFFLCHRKF